MHGRRLAELDLSLAIDSGRAERVLDAGERARAVASRVPPVRPPSDPEAAALLAELRQTIEALRAVEQDRAAAEPLLARRVDLQARIAERGWTRSGLGVVRDPVGPDVLRAALGDETLVSYVRDGARLHAVVVDSQRLHLVALGDATAVDEQVRRARADLDVLAQPLLPAPLRATVGSSLKRSLEALDAALLAPIAVPGRLVVVSTGLLGQLPWGLLPSLRGIPVVVAPSATLWHAAHTRPRSRPPSGDRDRRAGGRARDDEAGAVARTWRGRTVVAGPRPPRRPSPPRWPAPASRT